MNPPHLVRSRQIGDRPAGSQDPRVAPRGQPHGFGSLHKQPPSGFVRSGVGFEQVGVEFGVGACLRALQARRLYLTRPGDAGGDFGASFGRRRQGEIGGADRIDFDVKVDPITEYAPFQVYSQILNPGRGNEKKGPDFSGPHTLIAVLCRLSSMQRDPAEARGQSLRRFPRRQREHINAVVVQSEIVGRQAA